MRYVLVPSGIARVRRSARMGTCDTEAVEHQTRYARSGDVSIAYQVTGSGPFDLVFVFGSASHVEMSWQVPSLDRWFKRLSGFARLIIFDKRGTGMSDKVEGGFSLEARMDDVRAVMDAAGSERTAIVGVSEGVPMSILFAATYPDRVGAMVLYGGFARTLWAPDYPWGTPRPNTCRRSPMSAHVWVSQGSSTRTLGQGLRMPRVTRSPPWGDIFVMERARAPMRRSTRMNMGIDVRDVLPVVNVPTLVLHYAEDPWVSVQQGRYVAERIPGSRYIELPGRCHIPSLAEADTSRTPLRSSCSTPGPATGGRGRRRNGCWRRSCSPTSSDQRRAWPSSAMQNGRCSCNSTTRSFGGSWRATAEVS